MRRSRRTRLYRLAALLLVAASLVYLFYAPAPEAPKAPIESRLVTVSGRSRSFLLYDPGADTPGLLFVFHPSQSTGAEMRRIVGPLVEAYASKHQLIVVYPDGVGGHFNDCRKVASYEARREKIDDVGLARVMFDALEKERGLDARRVFALGFSNGGHMVLRLALEGEDLLKGGVVVAANLPAPENMDCQTAAMAPPKMVFVEGTSDPINPFSGGRVTLFGFGDRGLVVSAEDSAAWFAERLGLVTRTERPLSEAEGGPGSVTDWYGALGQVRLVALHGAGHTVPQAGYRFPRFLGSTVRKDAVLESALAQLEPGP